MSIYISHRCLELQSRQGKDRFKIECCKLFLLVPAADFCMDFFYHNGNNYYLVYVFGSLLILAGLSNKGGLWYKISQGQGDQGAKSVTRRKVCC